MRTNRTSLFAYVAIAAPGVAATSFTASGSGRRGLLQQGRSAAGSPPRATTLRLPAPRKVVVRRAPPAASKPVVVAKAAPRKPASAEPAKVASTAAAAAEVAQAAGTANANAARTATPCLDQAVP